MPAEALEAGGYTPSSLRYPPPPRKGLRPNAVGEHREQLREGYVQCDRQARDVDQRRIALAPLDPPEVGPVQARSMGQFFLRNAKPMAQLSHPSAEGDPEIVHAEDGWLTPLLRP